MNLTKKEECEKVLQTVKHLKSLSDSERLEELRKMIRNEESLFKKRKETK